MNTEKAAETRRKNIEAGIRMATVRNAPNREQYASLALRARRSPSAAIRLKCIECCGWDRAEAKACSIDTCALFAVSRRYFRVPAVGTQEAEV